MMIGYLQLLAPRSHLLLASAAGLMLLCATGSSVIAQEAVTQQQATAVAGQFAATLKSTLLAAIQQGGPGHAVTVCAEEAPRIAASLSETSGWMVKRVSLKPRNPTAAPDKFEQKILERFDALVATGHRPAAVFEIEGDEARMLVPQITEGLCLTCHGEPDGEVRALLREQYPTDTATGYLAGQVRGAISLRKQLDEDD
jgi:hypothetical protein